MTIASPRAARGLSQTAFVEVARVALAFLAVPLNARLLGPEGFALAVAGIAAANMVLPWLTFASPHSIVRLVVRQSSSTGIGRLVIISSLLASALLTLATGVAIAWPFPYALVAIAAMGFEFFAVAPGQIIASAALGRGDHTTYAAWATSPAVLRVIAAGSAFVVASADLASPAASFAIAHGAVAALFLSAVLVGANWREPVARQFFRSVFTLAGTQTAARAYDDCDKLLLPYMLSAAAAGNYAATYRMLAYALAPVRALLTALMPRLMECADAHRVRIFVRRHLPAVIATSLTATGILALGTLGGTEWILGSRFSADFTIVVVLGLSFVLRSVHFLVADALYATDRDALRLAIQSCLAVFSIALTWGLVSHYGAAGAATATLAMEIVALLTYGAALVLSPRSQPSLLFASRPS